MSDGDKVSRRDVMKGAIAVGSAAFVGLRGSEATPVQADDDLAARWRKLDAVIRESWDADLRKADEDAVRRDEAKTLLFLPHPYSSAGGSHAAFPEMYGWDTQFINMALLAHGRREIVRDHIRNQLFMIDRHGMVLNGNRTFYLTRSQPPLLAWSVERYLATKADDALALRAYPSLEREYLGYWGADHHRTPTGLTTCRDLGDPSLRPELAAEAESGLDFTPIFGGDIRRCVPIHVNACLVRYAGVLAQLAELLDWPDQTARWLQDAKDRSRRINELCWDEKEGYYFEYDFERKARLPHFSVMPLWLLWAGVASAEQAERVRAHLPRFDQPHGLSVTAEAYPSPHPEYKVNQWAYPAAWPPLLIIAVEGLDRYGFTADAERLARRFLTNQVATWEATGVTWERYDAVKGGKDCPVERYASVPLHGWSSAAAVLLGRRIFGAA
jgi:alpha,alpha-trehalase